MLVVVVGGASCAREYDEPIADPDQPAPTEDSGSAGRDAYVAAVAATTDYGLPLTAEQTRCIAAGYVDVIGLDVLRDTVTPEQIRDDPEADPPDWGVELDESQAEAIYDHVQGCDIDLVASASQSYAEVSADVFGTSPDTGCLERALGQDVVRDLFVTGLVQADDDQLSELTAGQIYDWFAQCVDMREALLSTLDDHLDVPEALLECIGVQIGDDFVQDFWITALQGSDALERSTLDDDLTTLAASCAPPA